jgi:hypothetical protein
MKPLEAIVESRAVEVALTMIVYTLYAAVIGASIAPALWLRATAVPPLLASPGAPWSFLRAGFVVASAFYLYVFWGAVLQSSLVRLLSLGIRPGRYPAVSLTTIRWLIFSGIYSLSLRTILPFVPMTFVINGYFRIVGCRMGRGVKLNTWMLNDAYLLTIGDNVIVGGDTDISCHLYENGHLTLLPITIGSGTLIGAHCYVSPGVTIGTSCVVGLCSFIRTGHTIPDGSVITSVAGIDVHTARELERGHLPRRIREWSQSKRSQWCPGIGGIGV